MRIWEARDENFVFEIIEVGENRFDLKVQYYGGSENNLWFPTYSATRNYIKREYGFNGRFKQVSK